MAERGGWWRRAGGRSGTGAGRRACKGAGGDAGVEVGGGAGERWLARELMEKLVEELWRGSGWGSCRRAGGEIGGELKLMWRTWRRGR
jgi:hypothetical protein